MVALALLTFVGYIAWFCFFDALPDNGLAFGLAEEYFRLHHRSEGSPNDDPALVAVLSDSIPLQNNKGKASISIGMRPLDLGKFKLNIDAAWSVDSSGVGGLIQDHQGQVRLSFTTKLVHSTSPGHFETVAIQEGLWLAERFGYSGFILENDCKGVVDQLRSRSGPLGLLGHIHEQIFSLVDKLNVSLSFVRRYANTPAHILVALAISTYSNIWIDVSLSTSLARGAAVASCIVEATDSWYKGYTRGSMDEASPKEWIEGATVKCQ
ncbi:hypothetical protein M9H77_07838 [Catharanthus roseus]|uniref:Uncharacterized protein n=1 Tax=Catharanthus roseus TaxID=4058 RepID=A0ACC0BWH3_CATRO|nr:hypothetical protein M9H77_07838 [Catharanthus roseus]